MFRFAISKDIFTSKGSPSYCRGKWKFGDVALQAVGRCNVWMGFLSSVNCAVSPGHIRVVLVAAAEGAVVKIQTFGASWEGILTLEDFLICKEHLADILAVFLAYKAVIQDGRFASGWYGVEMVQNCPFASWQILNCHAEISTAMVSSCVILRYWILIS